MAASIITPETDKQPKIIIPSFVEAPTPKNMPSEKDIEKWHDMSESEAVYKRKDVDPASFDGKLVFKPNRAYFRYDNDKGQNEVTYLFNVAVLTGKDKDGLWMPHRVDVTPENPNGRPNFITIPCRQFLDAFIPLT